MCERGVRGSDEEAERRIIVVAISWTVGTLLATYQDSESDSIGKDHDESLAAPRPGEFIKHFGGELRELLMGIQPGETWRAQYAWRSQVGQSRRRGLPVPRAARRRVRVRHGRLVLD